MNFAFATEILLERHHIFVNKTSFVAFSGSDSNILIGFVGIVGAGGGYKRLGCLISLDKALTLLFAVAVLGLRGEDLLLQRLICVVTGW